MIQSLSKSWWLLALCGILNAIISVIYLIMQGTDRLVTFHSWNSTIALLGELSMAAGACSIAAGIWRSTKSKCWPLVLNGLALCALGVIYYWLVRFGIRFLTIALLIIVMAISVGILDFMTARSLRRQHHVADDWLLRLAGLASVLFALPFLALAFRWIKLGPGSHVDLLWLGAFFAFSAICMLWLGLRLHVLGRSQSGRWEPLLPAGNPRHAH